MKSNARLKSWQFGAATLDALKCTESTLPEPGPGEVLVRVDAAALNYRDLLLISDKYRAQMSFPFVPASDLAGQIVATGPQVTAWHGGEKVISCFVSNWLDGLPPQQMQTLGVPGPGALASHVLLHQDWVLPAPVTLSAQAASTLPCAGLTAWFALIEQGQLRAGQTVLIHGTGGVALFGLQIARLHGARVIVISGSAEKRGQALALGAHHVLAREEDWPAAVMQLTGGAGVQHVLETVGGANLGRSLQTLARGGHVALIGVIAAAEFSGSAYQAIATHARIQAIGVGHRRALQEMIAAVDLNGLQPVIAAEYGFEDVPAAFAHLAQGAFGKIVIRGATA